MSCCVSIQGVLLAVVCLCQSLGLQGEDLRTWALTSSELWYSLGLGLPEGAFAQDVKLLLVSVCWAGQAMLDAALADADIAQDHML